MATRRGRTTATGFLRDFQAFILRGSVIDFSVALILAAAFGRIVESLVADVVTPALLTPALQAAQATELARLSFNGILYGKFLAAVLNFLVIGFVVFIIIKTIEAFKRRVQAQEEAAAGEAESAVELKELSQERLIEAIDRLTQVLEQQSSS